MKNVCLYLILVTLITACGNREGFYTTQSKQSAVDMPMQLLPIALDELDVELPIECNTDSECEGIEPIESIVSDESIESECEEYAAKLESLEDKLSDAKDEKHYSQIIKLIEKFQEKAMEVCNE